MPTPFHPPRHPLQIDAANALVGKAIMVLLGPVWGRAVIGECRVEWVEDGLVPRPLHKIIPVDETERKNGPASWEVRGPYPHALKGSGLWDLDAGCVGAGGLRGS